MNKNRSRTKNRPDIKSNYSINKKTSYISSSKSIVVKIVWTGVVLAGFLAAWLACGLGGSTGTELFPSPLSTIVFCDYLMFPMVVW